MTIKEVEARTGMTRANVRFYEQEGLLSPSRGENGYRDYTEADVETLKKIKLLRTLHMSLEEIREVHHGNRGLSDALKQLIASLKREQEDARYAQGICQSICDDGAGYNTLDAQRYLDRIEEEAHETVTVPAADAAQGVFIPWRRYFARMLDLALYSLGWKWVLAAVFRVNIVDRSVLEGIVDTIAAYAVMLALEPLFLSRLGTTPGKWIFGIRVMHTNDRRLTYKEARWRTWTVCIRGMCFSIPVYNLFRKWKSYQAYAEGAALEWEEGSVLSLKDTSAWRAAAFAGAHVILFGMAAAAVRISVLPPNRGNLTVAEFCANYNHYARFYGMDTAYLLDQDGRWKQADSSAVIVNAAGTPLPEFRFTEKDGRMTGLEFTVEQNGSEGWISDYSTERALAAFSFVRAQDSYSIFSIEAERLMKRMLEGSFEDCSFDIDGISIVCETEHSGYTDIGGKLLIPGEGQNAHYVIHFAIEKRCDEFDQDFSLQNAQNCIILYKG